MATCSAASPSLEILELGDNGLSELPDGLFEGLTRSANSVPVRQQPDCVARRRVRGPYQAGGIVADGQSGIALYHRTGVGGSGQQHLRDKSRPRRALRPGGQPVGGWGRPVNMDRDDRRRQRGERRDYRHVAGRRQPGIGPIPELQIPSWFGHIAVRIKTKACS